MERAAFLDRDGVLNELVFNPATGEYESPHHLADLALVPGMELGLKELQEAGYLLFLVSNQPSFAKGKTSLEEIKAIHERLHQALLGWGIRFRAYYYCYHHPESLVPELKGPCACRKPSPHFLLEAAREHGVDLGRSWMVGDQDSDVQCGRAAGTRTVLVENARSAKKRGASRPDFRAADLRQAAGLISRGC